MATFSATTRNDAVVPAAREDIWAVLTDPDLLAELTPLLKRITEVEASEGEALWRWEMSGIDVLGLKVAPCFTERMVFTEPSRIEYEHAPPDGTKEKASVEGWYTLEEAEGGTALGIELTISMDLPFPRASRPAVTRVMKGVIERTGDRFSGNLLRHLGVE